MNQKSFEAIMRIYRDARIVLQQERNRRFPVGVKVSVDQPGRYQGPGVTADSSDYEPDRVCVTLENGNTWQYQIECVSLQEDESEDELPGISR